VINKVQSASDGASGQVKIGPHQFDTCPRQINSSAVARHIQDQL